MTKIPLAPDAAPRIASLRVLGVIMRATPRVMVREAGTALAVLAIYVLTLLLPLHQTAALRRDLAAGGYADAAAFLCGIPAQPDADGSGKSDAPPSLKCPAAGIGKNEFAALLPAPAELAEVPQGPFVAGLPRSDLAPTPALPAHFGQSRAPPASV